MSAVDMREFKGTAWFARQLKISFAGVTTTACRRARIRAAILEQHREDEFADPFERLFGVPLTTDEMQYGDQAVTL